MDLFRPPSSGIQFAKVDHQKAFVGFRVLRSWTFPFTGGRVDPGHLLTASTPPKRLIHPMIRNPASQLVEKLMPLIQSLEESVKRGAVDL